jgi:glycine oxidase
MRVAIIGAGVAGLGIGWRLVQAGADVTVFDRAQPASGASWAAAGMIAPNGEFGDKKNAETDFARRSAGLWPEFARELEVATGVDLGYRRCGAYLLADNAEHAALLRSRQGGAFLDNAALRQREPLVSETLAGAAFVADDALVDNRALGQALVLAFVKAGGKLSPNEPVVRIDHAGGCVTALRTPFHHYEADAYLLCAGAWSSRFEGLPKEMLPPVIPVKGQMIALAPPSGATVPSAILWSDSVYMVPRRDRLLVGATVEENGFDSALTTKARHWLHDQAVASVPTLQSWAVTDHWAGLRPGTPDGLPILGRTALGGLYAATGQFRNGILFAPAIAEFLSGLILGRAEDMVAFDPRRFGGTP